MTQDHQTQSLQLIWDLEGDVQGPRARTVAPMSSRALLCQAFPHPQPILCPFPGCSVQSRAPCSWLTSLQAWAQAMLPECPCVSPGEPLQQAQPRDMSDSHAQTSNQLLHSSSPRPSQKAQSWLLGLKTLQHRAALFPGSGGAGG